MDHVRAAAVLVVALAFFAGCSGPQGPTDPSTPIVDHEPRLLQQYLKPDRVLSGAVPTASAPTRIPMFPMANAFVNEDLDRFDASAPLAPTASATGYHVSAARLVLDWTSDESAVAPPRADPSTATRFVFWIGADDAFPLVQTVAGPPVVEAGTRQRINITFDLPKGGWFLPPGAKVQLLAAPLVAHDASPTLYYLVDHVTTPSRIELEARPWEAPHLDAPQQTTTPVELTGNSGLFTGVAPDSLSVHTQPFRPSSLASWAEIAVKWRSTAAGKSDLDLTLVDGAGTTLASSTTPYQNETIRLWRPNLEALGLDASIRVQAYSGASTRFDVVVLWASNHTEP